MEPVIGGLHLVDLATIAGVALVLPAAFGGRWRLWAATAAAVAAACVVGRGSHLAVVLAAAWPLAVASVAAARLAPAWARSPRQDPMARPPTSDLAAETAGFAYALVAAAAFVLSMADARPLGFTEPIVQLAAVHFTFAGPGALVLAATARQHAIGAWRRLGGAAVALTAGAPPVVAAGFVSDRALLQVGGAVLMSLGVFATAAIQLGRAASDQLSPAHRLLLTVSGLAVWAPMVLAVAWAAAEHTDVPALSIPDMVRTHGMANALGFVGAGLVARAIDGRSAGDHDPVPQRAAPAEVAR